VVAPPGHHQKTVKIIHEFSGPSDFTGELLPLCVPNSSLDGILVQTTEEPFQCSGQIECVEAVRVTVHQKRIRNFLARQQPQLEILPPLPIRLAAEPVNKLAELTRVVQQGLTMI